VELLDGTARLAAMNLLLHGIGTPTGESLIEVKDALTSGATRYSGMLRLGCMASRSAIRSRPE
jgi:type I restriction enzyme M protein